MQPSLICFLSRFARRQSKSLAAAVSRSGQASEALGGPFIYTLILVLCTGALWRSAPAVVAISQMAAGDGVADLAGRRWGQKKVSVVSLESFNAALSHSLCS